MNLKKKKKTEKKGYKIQTRRNSAYLCLYYLDLIIMDKENLFIDILWYSLSSMSDQTLFLLTRFPSSATLDNAVILLIIHICYPDTASC